MAEVVTAVAPIVINIAAKLAENPAIQELAGKALIAGKNIGFSALEKFRTFAIKQLSSTGHDDVDVKKILNDPKALSQLAALISAGKGAHTNYDSSNFDLERGYGVDWFSRFNSRRGGPVNSYNRQRDSTLCNQCYWRGMRDSKRLVNTKRRPYTTARTSGYRRLF